LFNCFTASTAQKIKVIPQTAASLIEAAQLNHSYDADMKEVTHGRPAAIIDWTQAARRLTFSA